jgi:aminoglycoside phosphotransferase (APT) family kinase protein
MRPRPVAEVDITETLVRSLVASARADLAGRPLVEVGQGWDNSVWRLGEDLAVRVPRRQAAVELLRNEQVWLPRLAAALPLPVPAPVVLGGPTSDFPWPWSICRWVPGDSWAESPPQDQTAAARALGSFLRALHGPAPHDAPRSPFRGGNVAERDATVRARAAFVSEMTMETSPRISELLDLWDRVLVADAPSSQWRSWAHGDLHPLNLACRDGQLSGVLDFGDLTVGDPAVDLSVGWTVFDGPGRETLFATYGAAPGAIVRAAGWALNHGLACVTGSADHSAVASIGWMTLERLAEEPPG